MYLLTAYMLLSFTTLAPGLGAPKEKTKHIHPPNLTLSTGVDGAGALTKTMGD